MTGTVAESEPAEVRPLGLRERKRIAAMRRIQSEALDLFDARGFDGVTVEEIAEASEVSPSSVYRYFGTKEQLVLWDEWDPQMAPLVRAGTGASPLLALRGVMLGVVESMSAQDELRIRRRMQLVMATPTVEAASARHAYAVSEELGALLAERLGRTSVDLHVQVLAHAVVGALVGALHHWHGTGFREPLREVLDQCFAVLEVGFGIDGVRPDGVGGEPATGPSGSLTGVV
ncbi:TetR family transcriptional regulator [Actinotalea sp. K2]|uniref:acyl-CoA-like ligand-binding transcription factor n=1 Tax=Actinotalea sp. K2 TaxID=2939438 RepID=UPI0020179279|nr:TetR family transcriptional regulator [Actinotalea sp. K2]MCL3863082.1 TetR/AcrR family transcriptional regulator [Actinotalea sp. K2]